MGDTRQPALSGVFHAGLHARACGPDVLKEATIYLVKAMLLQGVAYGPSSYHGP